MVELGKTEIKSCEINNLKANLGVGTFDLNGKLTGTSKVDSGVGAININLIDNLDGKKLEIDRIYGTGENYLSVDGGIGEIKIDSKEQ